MKTDRDLFYRTILFCVIHLSTFVFIPYFAWKEGPPSTSVVIFVAVFMYLCGVYGLVVGIHRYWCHRTFKAKLPFKMIMAIAFTIMGEGPIIDWVIEHRVHHKYVETDADPHNTRRGLFFSNMGFMFLKEHPLVTEKKGTMYKADLLNDPLVQFQKKYYWPLFIFSAYVMPTKIMQYIQPELSALYCICLTNFLGLLTAYSMLSVNSVCHSYGHRAYDKNIQPASTNFMGILTGGEGDHNYHHVFPYDYKSSEVAQYRYNMGAFVIDFWAWLGQAYDLKTASENIIVERVRKTGDLDLRKDILEGNGWKHPYIFKGSNECEGSKEAHDWGYDKDLIGQINSG